MPSDNRSHKRKSRNSGTWPSLHLECESGLVNGAVEKSIDVFYWSGRNREVDFVLRRGRNLVAIEVKSGRRKDSLPGMEGFCREFPVTRKLLVGADGIPLEEFLTAPIETWVA